MHPASPNDIAVSMETSHNSNSKKFHHSVYFICAGPNSLGLPKKTSDLSLLCCVNPASRSPFNHRRRALATWEPCRATSHTNVKGPFLNNVYKIFGILDPSSALVCILARSTVLNSRNLLSYICCFWVLPSPSQCRHHRSMTPSDF